jgi:heat shock protein HslJ
MKPLKIFRTIAILSILVLSACAGGDDGRAAQLEGTSWVMTTYLGVSPLEGTQATIIFEEGRVSGIASCNHYGGSYEVKGDTIWFGDMVITEMYCMEPNGVMDQEAVFMRLLGAAERFEVVDGVLTIFADFEQTMTFLRQ